MFRVFYTTEFISELESFVGGAEPLDILPVILRLSSVRSLKEILPKAITPALPDLQLYFINPRLFPI